MLWGSSFVDFKGAASYHDLHLLVNIDVTGLLHLAVSWNVQPDPDRFVPINLTDWRRPTNETSQRFRPRFCPLVHQSAVLTISLPGK